MHLEVPRYLKTSALDPLNAYSFRGFVLKNNHYKTFIDFIQNK